MKISHQYIDTRLSSLQQFCGKGEHSAEEHSKANVAEIYLRFNVDPNVGCVGGSNI